MQIDAKLFEQQYNWIIERMKFIGNLAHRMGNGYEDTWIEDEFNGIEIEDGKITYNSSYHYSDGDTDYRSFTESLEDLSKPDEFFIERTRLENERKKKEYDEQRNKELLVKESKEKEEYLRLKEKFEGK